MIPTPDNITELGPKEIFVFGSNMSGRHGKGAARTAMKWGARYGQAAGLQGRTYGIPTVNASITNKLPVGKIGNFVEEFMMFAWEHRELTFLVTEIGCGLAGHNPKDIAPLFEGSSLIPNIRLPKKFMRLLSIQPE
jgi:hypothetical protein